ncbi:hypothetical protein [Paramagnetospirillum caucaseum]|uniref:hypothetical protein n=1 Tax=Paramagnetospirillum caucaseum TaxID=1244869 RepID=UPI0012687AEB|nr:hypothetical protein [Paramagnetospirillum caucaseum]
MMTLRILSFSAAVIMLVACDPSVKNEKEAISAVKKILIDPSSAQFEGLFNPDPSKKPSKAIKLDANDVCGMVNSKNRFGGYVGATMFHYSYEDKHVLIVDGADDMSPELAEVMRQAIKFRCTLI